MRALVILCRLNHWYIGLIIAATPGEMRHFFEQTKNLSRIKLKTCFFGKNDLTHLIKSGVGKRKLRISCRWNCVRHLVYNRYELAEMLGGSTSPDVGLAIACSSLGARGISILSSFFQFFMPLQLLTAAENYCFAICDCGKLVKRTLWYLLRFTIVLNDVLSQQHGQNG